MEQPINYIFCINTGRSGSAYLTKLLNEVENLCSFHEPEPICNGKAMQNSLNNDFVAMRELVEQKIEKIKSISDNGQLYAETNNCFIKGFGWLIPEYLPEEEIGVIFLKRDRTKIARSWLRITCSPLLKFGLDWIITPKVKKTLIDPPSRLFFGKLTYPVFRSLRFFFRGQRFYKYLPFPSPTIPKWITDYELECLEWYVDETEARGELYKKKFKNIRYYEVDVDQLNDFREVQRMLDYFGLLAKKTMADVVGKPANLMPWHTATRV